jgi:hypothetical protein
VWTVGGPPLRASGVDLTTPFFTQFPGAVSGYSLARKLKGSGVSYALRTRQAGDTLPTDIGFIAGNDVDSGLISTTYGANTARMETWYDQSGNAYHLNQAGDVLRPDVMITGSLQKINNKLAAKYTGTQTVPSQDVNWGLDAGLNGNPTFTVFIVTSKSVGSGGCSFGWGQTGVALQGAGYYDDGALAAASFVGNYITTTIPSTATSYLTTIIKTPGAIDTTTSCYRNGVSVKTGANSSSIPAINGNASLVVGAFANFAINLFNGFIQELIIYPSDQSANRVAIEANIRAYYGF